MNNMRYNRNIICLFAYLLLAAVLWPYLKDYVNNSDSYQYINVARLYASGYFSEAINGYWSPLISWLLLPFIKLGISGVTAFKFLQLTIGLFALRFWIQLVDRFAGQHFFREALKWVAVPLLLCYSYLYLTADLLFLTLQLQLILILVKAPLWRSSSSAIRLGLLGGVLYLSKAFGGPLFLGVVFLALYFHQRNASIRWKYVVISFVIFFAVTGTWVACISWKYGHFTISEAARFNATKEVAPLPEQLIRLPILFTNGIIPPAGAHALSASEEPMQCISLTPLNSWTNDTDRDYRLQVIKRNLLSIWYFDFRRQIGGVFLLLVILAIVMRKQIKLLEDPLLFYPSVFILLTYIGYAIILYHARYSWICTAMMLLLIVRVSEQIFTSPSRMIQWIARGAVVAALLLTLKRPIKELLFEKDKAISTSTLFAAITSPAATMESTYATDHAIAAAAESLRDLKGPFISRYSDTLERPPYYASLAVAESAQQPFFGQLDDQQPGTVDSLRHYGIRYFLVWNETPDSCFGKPPSIVLENVRVFDLQ
jgi:hypothetical protein